jgi:glycosyltransferase involved in cell wall biosynthesis
MNIAYLTETWPPEVNGVSLTVARTVRHLRERGHRVKLLRPRQRGEPARDDDAEWRTPGGPIPMYAELRFGIALPASVRRRLAGCELLHLATPGPLAWAALHAARSLGIATSSDFRTNFHQYSRHYGLGALAAGVFAALRGLHNGTDRTFVPTMALRRELEGQGFERLAVVGRGVDTARFDPARRNAALRAAWGAGAADTVLLHVGRLAPEKNVALALRAFEALRPAHPGLRMVVVGDGPARKALEAAHPAATFVGMQTGDELADCYASADLFVFPSLSETFGNVTLEALASGLPVVAYARGAAAEHVRDGAAGLLAEPGDEAGFVAAVGALATDPARRLAMRAEALAEARRARWDDVLARFEHQLRDVVQARAWGTLAMAGHE